LFGDCSAIVRRLFADCSHCGTARADYAILSRRRSLATLAARSKETT
jgi:hypothetical protein